MKEAKFKEGDLIEIWSPSPSTISNRKPKRFMEYDHIYGDETRLNEVMDFNHGKIGLVTKINLHKVDNPIYFILINGRVVIYGEHCLREVNK